MSLQYLTPRYQYMRAIIRTTNVETLLSYVDMQGILVGKIAPTQVKTQHHT